MKHITTVLFGLFALLIAQTAFGAADYLLKLDGVDGETKSTTAGSGDTGIAPDRAEESVVCTMEAKLCPDGSYVGRTGPRCEFTPCPTNTKVAPTPPPLPPGDPDFDLLKVAPPPPTPPVRGTGDPDFDLLKVAPPPPPRPTPTPSGDPDFDLLKTSPTPQNPIYDEPGTKGENPLYETDIKDVDDDGDGVPSKIEDVETSVSVGAVTVRGWDPKKKEAFMEERKEAAEVHSKQELEHFAQGVLLQDEKIEEVQFNPKELSVSYVSEGKLLWLIPVSFTERMIARGKESDNSSVSFQVKKPWWGFLVSGDDDSEEQAKEAEQKHKETTEISSWSWGVSNQARLLETMSTVLKTKHDTAKNSISNVR